jgi:hypothetical protein
MDLGLAISNVLSYLLARKLRFQRCRTSSVAEPVAAGRRKGESRAENRVRCGASPLNGVNSDHAFDSNNSGFDRRRCSSMARQQRQPLTWTLAMESRIPNTFRSHKTTTITTTAFKIDLMEPAMGMTVFGTVPADGFRSG